MTHFRTNKFFFYLIILSCNAYRQYLSNDSSKIVSLETGLFETYKRKMQEQINTEFQIPIITSPEHLKNCSKILSSAECLYNTFLPRTNDYGGIIKL